MGRELILPVRNDLQVTGQPFTVVSPNNGSIPGSSDILRGHSIE